MNSAEVAQSITAEPRAAAAAPAAQMFFEQFELVKESPDGVDKLRELIVRLAVSGKLTKQSEADESAEATLEAIANERETLIKSGDMRNPKPLPPISEDDVFHDKPPGWLQTQVGNVFEFAYGKSLPKKKRLNQGSVPVYGSNGQIGNHDEALVNEPSLVIGRKGSSGAVTLVERPFFPIDTTYFVTPPSLVDLKFSYYLLSSLRLEDLGSSIVPGLNREESYAIPILLPPEAEQRRIVAKVDALMEMCDSLEASLEHERSLRAASSRSCLLSLTSPSTSGGAKRANSAAAKSSRKASGADSQLRHAWQRLCDHFEVLFDVPETLADLRQSILQLAVQGKLVLQDPNDEPAVELMSKVMKRRDELLGAGEIRKRKPLRDDQIGGALFNPPCGWTWNHFDHLADLASGVTKGRKLSSKATASYPYLRVANVQRWELDLAVMKEIEIPVDELEKYRLQRGDLVMTEGGDWDKLGRTAIWNDEIDNCLHQNHVFRARLFHDGIDRNWIMLFINSRKGRGYFENASKKTTNLASINMTQLRSLPVPLPPRAEQERIVSKVSSLQSYCDELERAHAKRQSTARHLITTAIHHLLSNVSVQVVNT